jgi:hypothetical protein
VIHGCVASQCRDMVSLCIKVKEKTEQGESKPSCIGFIVLVITLSPRHLKSDAEPHDERWTRSANVRPRQYRDRPGPREAKSKWSGTRLNSQWTGSALCHGGAKVRNYNLELS